jgi:hypothetical protein
MRREQTRCRVGYRLVLAVFRMPNVHHTPACSSPVRPEYRMVEVEMQIPEWSCETSIDRLDLAVFIEDANTTK